MTRIRSLLVTGSKGFVGSSFLDYLSTLPVEERPLNLGLVTRNGSPRFPEELAAHTTITHIQAELMNPWKFRYPATHIAHFAADGSASAYSKVAADKFISMAEHLVSWSAELNSPTVFLASSGACFGHLPIGDGIRLVDSASVEKKAVFVQSRVSAENKLKEAQSKGQLDLRIGRLYSFIGKHLYEKPHYAVSSFVNMALNEGRIEVEGSPRTTRSYLSADDMADWIYASLRPGVGSEILSVGSEIPVTMKELADYIAEKTGSSVTLKNPQVVGDYYVANNEKTRGRLLVQERASWQTSVDEYIAFVVETRSNERR